MAARNMWLILPTDDFNRRESWQALGDDRFGGFRAVVLVARSNGASRLGPPVAEHTIAPHDTIMVEHSHERIVSGEETISAAIKSTVVSRVCDVWTSKIGAELKGAVLGASAKAALDLQKSTTAELSDGLEQSLSATASHRIETIGRTRHAITLTGADSPRTATLRRRYRPEHWDIYLFSLDALELRHRRNWSLHKIRETITRTESGVLGWPICRLTFYTPQQNLDVSYGPVADVLESPDSVDVAPVPVPMPSARAPQLAALEDCASIAFPGTPTEREAARKTIAGKTPARKAAAKKAPAKRAPAKKAAARKVPAPKAPAKG